MALSMQKKRLWPRATLRGVHDVSGFADRDSPLSTGHHHGAKRRNGELRRIGTAQQQARSFFTGKRPRSARPLRNLHGEQRSAMSNAAARANAPGSTTPASIHI